MDETFRSPNAIEWALLKKLLETGLLGRDELFGQLDGLLVKTIDRQGSLSLRPVSTAAPAEVQTRVVAEGCYSDEGKRSIEEPQVRLLLHVVEGRLAELEIYKDDGSPIIKRPTAERLITY